MAKSGVSFPSVKQSYFPCVGGVDMVTPPIAIKPGVAVGAQNYTCEKAGGYRRLDGYCRYDGRVSPVDTARYAILKMNTTTKISVGDIITGDVSKARAKVLLVVSPTEAMVSYRSGEFTIEHFFVSGKPVGFTQSIPTTASDSATDAAYSELAIDDLRGEVQFVPGGGPVRGIAVLDNVVFAFRDDKEDYATESVIWRASATGWQRVTMPWRVHFKGETGNPNQNIAADMGIKEGDVIVCGAFREVVKRALVRVGSVSDATGEWDIEAEGTLIFEEATYGTISAGDTLYVNGKKAGVATSQLHRVHRDPGGMVESINANFSGAAMKWRVYGVDGINNGFEFDGSLYVPIETGMATDAPSHVASHLNALWFSFAASVQMSGAGDPFSWTAITGAAEIATGDAVTAMVPLGGGDQAASLVIFTEHRTHVLYGQGMDNMQLLSTTVDTGYAAKSVVPFGNGILGQTSRGIQTLAGTLSYGNFAFTSLTQNIAPFFAEMARMKAKPVGAIAIRARDEYRLFFDNGYCLSLTMAGDTVIGAMPLYYAKHVTCAVSHTYSINDETRYFADADGYVYQDGKGFSFDGASVEAWLRLPFFHDKTPTLRKRYMRSLIEMSAEGYCEVDIGYDLGYGNANVLQPVPFPDVAMAGGSTFWDMMTWDIFKWDSVSVESPAFSLTGTERNIAFLFWSAEKGHAPHTIQGIMLNYIPRRLER